MAKKVCGFGQMLGYAIGIAVSEIHTQPHNTISIAAVKKEGSCS